MFLCLPWLQQGSRTCTSTLAFEELGAEKRTRTLGSAGGWCILRLLGLSVQSKVLLWASFHHSSLICGNREGTWPSLVRDILSHLVLIWIQVGLLMSWCELLVK